VPLVENNHNQLEGLEDKLELEHIHGEDIADTVIVEDVVELLGNSVEADTAGEDSGVELGSGKAAEAEFGEGHHIEGHRIEGHRIDKGIESGD